MMEDVQGAAVQIKTEEASSVDYDTIARSRIRSVDGVYRPVAVNTLSRPPSDGGVDIGSPSRNPDLRPESGGAIPQTASADIPPQSQPQFTPAVSLVQAADASVANPPGVLPEVPGDQLSLKPVNEAISLATAADAPLSAGNGWQTSLLQQYDPNHTPLTGTSNFGKMQSSVSLAAFSNQDEYSHKRQVRLLKNREDTEKFRQKTEDYMKCLKNQVAVLENQHKALIDEQKTPKKLYYRKELSQNRNGCHPSCHN